MLSLSRHQFSLSSLSRRNASTIPDLSSGEYWQLTDEEPAAAIHTTIHARRKRRASKCSKRSTTNNNNTSISNANSGFPEVERLSFFPPYQSHTRRRPWAELARSCIDRIAAKLRPSASSSTPFVDADITFNFQHTLMASNHTLGPLPTSSWNLFSRFKR